MILLVSAADPQEGIAAKSPPSHAGTGSVLTRRQSPAAGLAAKIADLAPAGFPAIVSKVIVQDGAGTPVGGLKAADFSVYEDGALQQPLQVEAFGGDSGGVSVVLLMDVSGSMRDELPDAQAAAITLVQFLRDSDQAALISFNDQVKQLQDFTRDKALLTGAINSLRNGSGTAVYDATIAAVQLARTQPGNRAIVLLSDGRDGNSSASLEETIALLATADIPLYVIALGIRQGKGDVELKAMVSASNGIYYETPTSSELEEIYRNIAFLISRYFYRITYTSSNCAADGTVRRVRVEARQNGAAAVDTASYRAPGGRAVLAAAVDGTPVPGETFTLRLEIPAGSPVLLDLTELAVSVRYAPDFLDVAAPPDQHIRAGGLFGPASDHSLSYALDESAGLLSLHVRTTAGAAPVSGTGTLVEIEFSANLNMPDNSLLHFGVEVVSAKNSGGCNIRMESRATEIRSSGLIVWPGDTNADSRVSLPDVLRLGLYWEMSGPAREGPDQLAWMPHAARKFAVPAATHADADGDGRINERDLVPVGLNWGKSTGSFQSRKAGTPQQKSPSPLGRFRLLRQPAQVETLRIQLELDRANDAPLLGVVLRLRYPPNALELLALAPGDIWPAPPLVFQKNEKQKGLLALGMMLPAGQDVSTSGGPVAELVLRNISAVAHLPLTVELPGLVAADGRITEAAAVASVETEAAPEAFTLSPAFPNPFNPATALNYQLAANAEVVFSIFNAAGRKISERALGSVTAGAHQFRWNGTDGRGKRVSSGLYLIRMCAITRQGEQLNFLEKVSLVR